MKSRETTHMSLHHRESKYPISRLSPGFNAIQLDREKSPEESQVLVVANSQLEIIAEQIRSLQERAQEIITRAELDIRLHRVRCGFQKRTGITYHLYETAGGSEFLSLISPTEWGTPPHKFLGSYVMCGDMSWKKTQ